MTLKDAQKKIAELEAAIAYHQKENVDLTNYNNDVSLLLDKSREDLEQYRRDNLFSSASDGIGILLFVVGCSLSVAALTIYSGSTISWLLMIAATLMAVGLLVGATIPKAGKVGASAAWILLLALFTYQQAVKTSEASFKAVDAGSVGSYATASGTGDIVWDVSRMPVILKLGEKVNWLGGDSAHCGAKGLGPNGGVVDRTGGGERVKMGPGALYTFDDGTSVRCEQAPDIVPTIGDTPFALPSDWSDDMLSWNDAKSCVTTTRLPKVCLSQDALGKALNKK